MDWVLTYAQYELLVCDAPVVVYDNVDNVEGKAHTAKEMEEMKKNWEAKRKEREEKGQRISLNDFMANGINAIRKNTK